MKHIKTLIVMLLLSGSLSFIATSCGALSNMSEEDAYGLGWYTGRAIRTMIDN